MKNKFIYLLPLFLFSLGSAFGQLNFRAILRKADPVPKNSDLSLQEKVKIHQAFYDTALLEKNTAHQVYGQVLLALDYIKAVDYAEATRHLLTAEAIAKENENSGWKGWIFYQKGIVAMRMKNWEEALQFYQAAASQCGEAGDSLCMAENLEQASVMHGFLDDFEKALRTNEQAMPLLKKFGEEKQLATALANFGGILSMQDRPGQAIPYFERAIELQQKLGNQKSESKALNNLANAYRKLGKYDLAVETFQRCIHLNQENNLLQNLVHNYVGMGLTYDSIGDFRVSRIYFEKYEILKDSLIGAETQQKIAELEIKYEAQQKELELEKTNSKLVIAQRSLERRTWLIAFGLLLAAAGLWRWYWEKKRTKREQAEKQITLNGLTRILIEKNQQLSELKEQISASFENQHSPIQTPDSALNLFDLKILTDADWVAFKAYFEKAQPGLMGRLRGTFPTLTDAEERLFLFIKLNLTTKEAASILGISADSVKKTRNRLRKKLELDEDVVLKDFIQGF